MKTYREIVKIDEEKCNGCGVCIPSCKEGALQIVDGKARLVSDVYCDGLGACLGTCPQGAITIEKREAEGFDEEKVEEYLKTVKQERRDGQEKQERCEDMALPCGCPGMMAKRIEPKTSPKKPEGDLPSQLSHWPIQLTLVPANAPYLKDADLLLLADCAGVAYANLHRDFIAGKVVLMACPKLDDANFYKQKLAQILVEGRPRTVQVVMMEVPCCQGLFAIAQEALHIAGANVELKKCIISVDGKVM